MGMVFGKIGVEMPARHLLHTLEPAGGTAGAYKVCVYRYPRALAATYRWGSAAAPASASGENAGTAEAPAAAPATANRDNEGFRVLAGYIFGKNEGGGKVAMTAPVVTSGSSSSSSKGEKVAMTAPVVTDGDADGGVMQFILPAQYTDDPDSLPKPLDDRVSIEEVPARVVGILEFSGLASDSDVAEKKAALLQSLGEHEELAAAGLAVEGEPWLQRYNPPWTLPFLRTNEVAVRLSETTPEEGDAANADSADGAARTNGSDSDKE